MQHKCDFCQDTGSLHLDSDLLDCSHCDATTGRIALDQWLAEQYKQGGMTRTDSLAAWRIHQRALAMAPKQEAPAQEPVAEIISGWQIVFVGAGPIAPIVEKHKLHVGAKLYAVGTVPPPEGWRDALQRLRDNTETFGQYSQETARVAIEGCIDALDELEPVAAPAAANGAMTDEQIKEVAINYASHVAGDVYDVTKYDCAEDFFNCIRAILAAAGPNAAPPDEKIMKLCKCKFCKGEGWVCENHADKPWTSEEGGCKCGAGAPCTCNSNVDLPEGFIILSGAKGN